ncbi:PorV/PorQ family protein [bacterium]|nr:PorV/PorQ family protein [bacterium]
MFLSFLRKIKRTSIVSVMVFVCLPFAVYSEDYAETGGRFLLQTAGARVLAIGEAYTAVADDIYALYYNPGGLAKVKRGELNAQYRKGLVDTYYGFLGITVPTEHSTLGASFFTFQGGEIEINELDGTSETLKAEEDYVVSLGIGYYLDSVPGKLGFGVAVKVISSKLVEEYEAYALAMDIGGYYDTAVKGLSIGFVFQNIGTKINYLEHADPLHFTSRLGIAYKLDMGMQNHLWTSLDIISEDKVNVGMEFAIKQVVFFRAGYKHGYDLESFTCGVGFSVGMLRIDYALGLMGTLGENHLISITFRDS